MWDDAIFGDRLDITWRGRMPTPAELKDYKALIAKAGKNGKAAPLTAAEKAAESYKKYSYNKEGMHNMNDAAKARAYRVGRL